MEVKIQLNGVKAKDGAKVLTGAKIRGDGKCDIQAENIFRKRNNVIKQ